MFKEECRELAARLHELSLSGAPVERLGSEIHSTVVELVSIIRRHGPPDLALRAALLGAQHDLAEVLDLLAQFNDPDARAMVLRHVATRRDTR